MNKVIL